MSDPVASYRIRAELDTAKHTVSAHETLTWRNRSPDAIGELRFHLYLNAFRDDKSTFMRESGGHLRGDRAIKDSPGSVDIRSMRIAGGPDLTGAIRFVHPDDDNANDRTVAAVALPQPLPPGATLALDIDFVSKLPKVFARTGYHNDFYMVAQWFPKMAVYQPGRGWNAHQFHATSEFFADFGTYDVIITAPAPFMVGATGVEQSVTEDPARRTRTWTFHQDDIHDFAWTASPRFVRVERVFDPARSVRPEELAAAARLLGRPAAELALKPVRMILLMQPEHRGLTERHVRALENGLKWYGLWYGAYPYDTITLVDPPYGADGAGGMEYPTLITGGTNWWPGAHDVGLEEVVIHEFGHQYWYGMVATNEFEESWLDEGFNTYSSGKVVDVAYGPRTLPLRLLGVPVAGILGLPRMDSDSFNRSAYLEYGKYDPVVKNAWSYYDEFRYAVNSYERPAILLRTLENYLGAPVMARIMRAWFERYRFRHPTSRDFEALVNELAGRDMTWFFDQFVFGTNWLDYRIGELESERSGGEYRIRVRLVRAGEAIFPVEMKLTLAKGEVIRQQWDGRDRWVQFEYVLKSRARSAELDPQRKVLLDGSFANNSYVVDPPLQPFAKWTSNLLFWLQMVLP